jgi:3-hydroxyacyl-[acyl-carrier-protein] dehydratase
MAVEPILDMSQIDLRGVAMDREEIARWLPHRGHMAQLDAVVWLNDELSRGVALKRVRDDEFWCAGHIPGKPIMPGVLMIEAGAQLASFMYYRRTEIELFAGFTRIENTSFRGQVVPGDDLYILCREVKFSPRRFVTDIQGVLRGEVVFDGQITGMTLPQMGKIRENGRLVLPERSSG